MSRRSRPAQTALHIFGLLVFALCLYWLIVNPQPADAAYKTCNPGDAPIYSVSVQRIGSYYVTGYNALDRRQRKRGDGITASGLAAVAGHTIAMRGLKFGTRVYIAGLPGVYTVEDRGVGYGVVDVACGTRSECFAITGRRQIFIIKYL